MPAPRSSAYASSASNHSCDSPTPASSSSSSFANRSSVSPITSQSLFHDVPLSTSSIGVPDHDSPPRPSPSRTGSLSPTADVSSVSIEVPPTQHQPPQQERRTRASGKRPPSSPVHETAASQSTNENGCGDGDTTRASSTTPKMALSTRRTNSGRSVLPIKVMEVSPLPVIGRGTMLQEVKVEDACKSMGHGRMDIPSSTGMVENEPKTPANTSIDEKFTFKVLTENWQQKTGPVLVLAYPPGVNPQDYSDHITNRKTVTAHSYPFRDIQIRGWVVFSLSFWQQYYQMFLAPLSTIGALIIGIQLGIVGMVFLISLPVVSVYMMMEFEERKELYYQLLDHHILINFHNVIWYKSRRFWLIVGLSFGFLLECWSGLHIQDIFVLANTLFVYGLSIRGLLQMEDNLMSFSRVSERYESRNMTFASFATFVSIDENVIRYYLWKLARDSRCLLPDKTLHFSLAPLAWAISTKRIHLNVALVNNTCWFTCPKSLSVACYNKCYAHFFRISHRFSFDLAPAMALMLASNDKYHVLQAQKKINFFKFRREISVLLVIEHAVLLEFSNDDFTADPLSIIPLRQTSMTTESVSTTNYSEVILRTRASEHRWIVQTMAAISLKNLLNDIAT